MNNINLEKKILKIIADNLNISKNEIRLDARIEDLSQDSMQLFGLIMVFEKEFDNRISYEDLIKIETVGDIINYINKFYGHV